MILQKYIPLHPQIKLKNKNMKAFVFPGQGAQFVGMGKDLYETCLLYTSDAADE